MAKKNKDTQKGWFYEGAYPTDTQFHEVIESTLGVLDSTDDLPVASSENLGDEYKIGNTFYKCEQSGGSYSWVPKATAVPTNSYNDITHKPTIKGVLINGDIADIDDLGGLSKDSTKYDTVDSSGITSSNIVYLNNGVKWVKTTIGDIMTAMNIVVTSQLTTIAAAIKTEVLASINTTLNSKLDKDLSNVTEIANLSDDAYIPVVTSDGTRKITANNVSAYTEIKAVTRQEKLDYAIAKERKKITLEGEQDGTNADFTSESGWVTGTTALYLNGQLLTPSVDYTEVSAYQITMLTHIPVEDDVLILMAIPL